MKPLYRFSSTLVFLFAITTRSLLLAQTPEQNRITIATVSASGNVSILYCVNGFGGGNVAASVGDDGILLVDDMYVVMAPKLEEALKTLSPKPVRVVLNTHFHRDHIEGNIFWRKNAMIIGHENISKQLLRNSKDMTVTQNTLPMVTFSDHMTVHFNGEDIQITHFPNSHTDGDAMVYFTQSKVAHLGDMFFVGMFPAVYSAGGGDLHGLITSLESIAKMLPSDAKVIPGHGALSSVKDLDAYITMLKTTTQLVQQGIAKGKSLEQLQKEKILNAYDALGEGGGQSTDQYTAMLYQLLTPKK